MEVVAWWVLMFTSFQVLLLASLGLIRMEEGRGTRMCSSFCMVLVYKSRLLGSWEGDTGMRDVSNQLDGLVSGYDGWMDEERRIYA
jgi:hypothetical protein